MTGQKSAEQIRYKLFLKTKIYLTWQKWIPRVGAIIRKAPELKKRKKLSTRVDLTPMVDLGFSAYYVLYFHHYDESANSNELALPKDTDSLKSKIRLKKVVHLL